jgi:hypothetical protein
MSNRAKTFPCFICLIINDLPFSTAALWTDARCLFSLKPFRRAKVRQFLRRQSQYDR